MGFKAQSVPSLTSDYSAPLERISQSPPENTAKRHTLGLRSQRYRKWSAQGLGYCIILNMLRWTLCESLSTHIALQPNPSHLAGQRTFDTSIQASKLVLNLESSRSSGYKQLQALPINDCPSDTKQAETKSGKVRTLALSRGDRGSGGGLRRWNKLAKALGPPEDSTPD